MRKLIFQDKSIESEKNLEEIMKFLKSSALIFFSIFMIATFPLSAKSKNSAEKTENQAKSSSENAKDEFKEAGKAVGNAGKEVGQAAKGVGKEIGSAAKSFGKGVKDAFKGKD